MVMAAKTALLQNMITENDFERIVSILRRSELPVHTPKEMSFSDFMRHMKRDKKVLAGNIRFILPTTIGTAEVVKGIPEETLEAAIDFCRTL